MKKKKTIGTVLIILSILALPTAFSISCHIGETDIFGIGGALKFSHVMLIAVPVSIASIIYGIYLRKIGENARPNFVIAVFCIPPILLLSCFKFLSADDFDYTTYPVTIAEEKAKIDLPNSIEAITEKWIDYNIIRVKITNESEKRTFEEQIDNDGIWRDLLERKISNALPFELSAEISKCSYFIFYNETTGEYNQYPSEFGEYKCMLFAYNKELGSFVIIDEFILIDN